ncbi:IclR family transcriptional regulator [Rhodococcoides trifolii]|nr:IclR family transcriptional regulator [Rhodococcus trifolii]
MIARVFAVLNSFGDNRTRLTQSDLSRSTGLPLPTVHRLCRQLVDHGALERDDDGHYTIGVRIWELGSLAPRAHGLRQVALPYLEDLYEATHQNVQLVVLDGTDALYIERLSARNAVPLISRAGGRLPLHASSGGLVLLAHNRIELLDQVLAGGLAAFTPHTVTDEHRLRSVLADIRRTGVVVCREYLNLGSLAIAAPVRRGNEVVAAVSVVISVRDDPAPVVPALRAACRAISRGLI